MKPKADLKGRCRLPATAKKGDTIPTNYGVCTIPEDSSENGQHCMSTALLTGTRTSRWLHTVQQRGELCFHTALLQRLEPRMPCILNREWWVGENFLRITDPAQAESCTAKCCLVFLTHGENTVTLGGEIKLIRARTMEAYFPNETFVRSLRWILAVRTLSFSPSGQ